MGSVEKELIELCDRFFVNPLIQTYSGSNFECLYCGATKGRNGEIDHSYADCPVIKYEEILTKFKELQGNSDD